MVLCLMVLMLDDAICIEFDDMVKLFDDMVKLFDDMKLWIMYIHICYFNCRDLKKKQIKHCKTWLFCRVQTHGICAKPYLPCTSTRQTGHVSPFCRPGMSSSDHLVNVPTRYTRRRAGCTAEAGTRRTTGPTAPRGRRSKATHGTILNTVDILPCTLRHTADQPPTWPLSAHWLPLFYRAGNKCTRHNRCRASVARTHGRTALPLQPLPCSFCRVFVHGIFFAVSNCLSAVYVANTVKHRIPVVRAP
jgi:hypothetical protein